MPSSNGDKKEKSISELLSKLSDNKISDWKETLSGALDDQRLFFALFTVALFNFIYIAVSYAQNKEDLKDEDSITELCKCNTGHRCFYISWFTICSTIWAFCHFMVFMADHWDFWNNTKKCCCCCYFEKDICCKYRSQKPGLNNLECCLNKCIRETQCGKEGNNHKDCCCCCCCCCCCHIPCSIYNNFYKYITNNDKITQYEFHLWTQYCELYVVGITKNNENYTFDSIIKEVFEVPEASAQQSQDTETDKVAYDTTAALPNQYSECHPWFLVQVVFFLIIKFIQFFAQLAVVPLLLIQLFDTYAFLCFTADSYCSMRDEYKLHLDQTALTFGFYFALMTSLLSTIMLRWFPWPTCEKKKGDGRENTDVTPTQAGDLHCNKDEDDIETAIHNQTATEFEGTNNPSMQEIDLQSTI